ncbi:Protein Csh3 [Malassezia pachydermatis]
MSSYDYPLLFHGAFGKEEVRNAIDFYLSIYSAPLSVKALIHAIIGLGMIGIVAKIVRWQENDKYFGSISLLLYFVSVLMYIGVNIPNMRALKYPDEMRIVHRAVFDAEAYRKVENYDFKPLSERETTSVVQVISATNVIITVLLAGVLLMQIGEWYAVRLDRIAENKMRQESIAKLGAQRGDEKKKN